MRRENYSTEPGEPEKFMTGILSRLEKVETSGERQRIVNEHQSGLVVCLTTWGGMTFPEAARAVKNLKELPVEEALRRIGDEDGRGDVPPYTPIQIRYDLDPNKTIYEP